MARIPRLNNKPITQCTPQELRAAAAACRARVEASFHRSDTDGSLSQWSGSMTARIYDLQAKINEADGYADHHALLDADGNEVSRHYFADYKTFPDGTRAYVHEWLLTPAQRQQYGRFAIPAGPRSRIQRQLGLHEGTIRRLAFAGLGGHGTGLSGAASAVVKTFLVEDADAEPEPRPRQRALTNR